MEFSSLEDLKFKEISFRRQGINYVYDSWPIPFTEQWNYSKFVTSYVWGIECGHTKPTSMATPLLGLRWQCSEGAHAECWPQYELIDLNDEEGISGTVMK